jgi:uncharacterized protein (DUF1697 family)
MREADVKYIALLRAVNVGGHNKVPMADFRALLSDLGHGDVRTFIQSGNAVFSSDRNDSDTMEREIEAAIRQFFTVETPVMIRASDELADVVASNPFPETGILHVAFLSGQPEENRLAQLDPQQFAPDAFAPGHRALYLLNANGVHKSKLTHTIIERRLGVKQTTRNWNTVNKLRDMAAE